MNLDLKRIVFVVPLTPAQFMTPLRGILRKYMIKSLLNLKSDNWTALLMGEEEYVNGNLKFINTSSVRKMDKLHDAYNLIINSPDKPGYIIRMDDDDLISSDLGETIDRHKFDCYADEYHTFYDIISDRIGCKKMPWLPNTVVHKYEHAFAQVDGQALILHDHSKVWHEYYRDKNVTYSKKFSPIYLRTVTPTITSINEDTSKITLKNMISAKKYALKRMKLKNMSLNEKFMITSDLYREWNEINPYSYIPNSFFSGVSRLDMWSDIIGNKLKSVLKK